MTKSSDLRLTRIALNNGSGYMPALGCGTLIPDPVETKVATRAALEAGFRHFDCAERYRNEREIGESLREHFCYHKVVELQSSAPSRRTSLRSESE
jgi:alcohol dehydrogenase (NADP+)